MQLCKFMHLKKDSVIVVGIHSAAQHSYSVLFEKNSSRRFSRYGLCKLMDRGTESPPIIYNVLVYTATHGDMHFPAHEITVVSLTTPLHSVVH